VPLPGSGSAACVEPLSGSRGAEHEAMLVKEVYYEVTDLTVDLPFREWRACSR
jgi:hypothetical protein